MDHKVSESLVYLNIETHLFERNRSVTVLLIDLRHGTRPDFLLQHWPLVASVLLLVFLKVYRVHFEWTAFIELLDQLLFLYGLGSW